MENTGLYGSSLFVVSTKPDANAHFVKKYGSFTNYDDRNIMSEGNANATFACACTD